MNVAQNLNRDTVGALQKENRETCHGGCIFKSRSWHIKPKQYPISAKQGITIFVIQRCFWETWTIFCLFKKVVQKTHSHRVVFDKWKYGLCHYFREMKISPLS